MKKDKNLDELFREKLLNYEQEPPAYLLGNILDGAARPRRKRIIMFWRLAGVAAALLLAFVAGWQFNAWDDREFKQPVVAGQHNTPETKIQKEQVTLNHQSIPKTSLFADTDGSNPVQNRNSEVASRSSMSEPELDSEKSTVASTNESVLMKPLNSLYRLIKQEGGQTTELQERKTKNSAPDWIEKTIDQQIMEQNQQIALVRNEKLNKSRWLVGAQVSPAYSVNRSNQTVQYASNMLNSSSGSPVELGGGVSVEYKTGKRWSIQSGVYYSGLAQTSGNTSRPNGKEYMYADLGSGYFNTPVNIESSSNKMQMNSTAGVIEFSSIPGGIVVGNNIENNTVASAVFVSDARFIQNFEYIEIPVYLRYILIDSRLDVEMLGGFSSNLLVGNQTFMENDDGKSLIGKTNDMETLNYSGTLGIGLKYGLSKRIFLNVEPRVKYYLNSLNNNASVTYKPYTIGVFTGLSYEF